MSNGNTETEEETGGNEHLKIHRRALENDSEDHDDRANKDTPAATQAVGNVGSNRQSEQGTEKHDSREKTLDATRRIIHIIFELLQREKTVNHGPIVTIGGRSQDNKEEEEIGLPQVWKLEPVDIGKIFAGHPKVALHKRGIRHGSD